ncbi:hypothetical protein GCM10027592_33330 [Spirosoma flavus]
MKYVPILLVLCLELSIDLSAQNLYLNQAGDVGVGTKTPSARFNVSSTGENAMRIDGVNPYVLFRNVNEPDPNGQMREFGFIRTWTTNPFNSAGYYGLELGVPPPASGQPAKHLMLSTNYVPRLTILNNGRVGIGTTTPYTTLDVAGTSHFVGPMFIEGSNGVNPMLAIMAESGNSLLFLENKDIGPCIQTRSKNFYTSLWSQNTGWGAGLVAATFNGQFSGIFEGGRVLIKGDNSEGRSGGIEFRNSFYANSSLGFMGMNGDTEMGFFGYGLGDWILRMNVGTGAICSRSNITLCSDQRLKRDVTSLTASLTNLSRLQGRHYFWQNDQIPGLQTGFIAQEVQAVFPELVQTDDKGFLSVNYTGFIPHLVEAVKELKRENNVLAEENAGLRNQLEDVLKRLSRLESGLTASR